MPLFPKDVQQRIDSEAAFAPFRPFFEHAPLRDFIVAETVAMTARTTKEEQRFYYKEEHDQHVPEKWGGYTAPWDVVDSDYHPQKLQPFELTALWLPLSAGQCFHYLTDPTECPLIREREGGYEWLYLIHPASLAVHADLLAQYQESAKITVAAIALSSFRSLLIALPTAEGSYEPHLVKISLDQQLGGASRLLQQRECALSVANSHLLQQKVQAQQIDMNFFKDTAAFVPAGLGFGMLYRQLPAYLHPSYQGKKQFLYPCSVLTGANNQDFFSDLLANNGGCASLFLEEKFLQPFADLYVTLLYQHHISLEAHGQNLLFTTDASGVVNGLVFRDMGGVNYLPTEEESTSLKTVAEQQSFYKDSHIADAASALEDHFVMRFLYYLTQQLLKMPIVRASDPFSKQMYQLYEQNDLLANWTTVNDSDDKHATLLPLASFNRYGHMELLFLQALLKTLQKNNYIDEETVAQRRREFNSKLQYSDGVVTWPCADKQLFKEIVLASYQPQRLLQWQTECESSNMGSTEEPLGHTQGNNVKPHEALSATATPVATTAQTEQNLLQVLTTRKKLLAYIKALEQSSSAVSAELKMQLLQCYQAVRKQEAEVAGFGYFSCLLMHFTYTKTAKMAACAALIQSKNYEKLTKVQSNGLLGRIATLGTRSQPLSDFT